MAVTQSAFERTLQGKLDQKGFELNLSDVKELLDIVGSTVEGCLKQDQKEAKKSGGNPAVTVRGIGKFAVRKYKARMGRNPQTGDTIKIAASQKLRMTPVKTMRDNFNTKKPAAKAASGSRARSRKR